MKLTPRAHSPNTVAELEEYDFFVAGLGYESRCIHAAQINAGRYTKGIAVSFPDRQVLSFEENKRWFIASGFTLVSRVEDAVAALMDAGAVRILIDISSMSRPMMAALVRSLAVDFDTEMRVDFLYSPACYSIPGKGGKLQTSSGPVSPSYAGWTDEPELPLCAFIGLGYEADRALGVLEYLEPSAAWIFVPTSSDEPLEQKKYDEAIQNNNSVLKNLIPDEQYIPYDVSRPFDVFVQLEAMVYGVLGRSRPLIAPFGPKLFALASILVGEIYHPSVTIWRISAGRDGEPKDLEAMGPVYRLPVTFENAGSV